MSERCQEKFTENFENQNYIIFGTVSIACVAVLYFYKFHFATIVVSYVLGCIACYLGLKSTILQSYIEKLKRNFLYIDGKEKNCDDTDYEKTPAKSCLACGAEECTRHDVTMNPEPWVGLRVHKQLDQAIEDFYNSILEQFITTWYSKISPQPFFVDELRQQLRYASACLLRRAIKINYSHFITERLIPCALRHYILCADLPEGVPLLDSKLAIHPAAANRNAELKYLRCITNAIMPYLLKSTDLQNAIFRVVIRELFAGWVLLSLTDVLADPYILNALIILGTGDQTMAKLPDIPNYRVEFLETFVRQMNNVYTSRNKLLRLDLEMVLNDQEYFYAFMQFMKNTGHFHLLQFCKEIKSFQTRILNPELSPNEQVHLFKEAWDIWVAYFDPESPTAVSLDPVLVEEMRMLLAAGAPNVKKLQTSRALYQAARQSHVVLERVMLPRFLHSEEYYKLILGSRTSSGYHKQMTKKPSHNILTQSLKLGSKLRGALKSHTLDGRVIDYTNSNSDINIDLLDNVDLLKYLAQEEALREQDLSTCKVVLTQVETRLQAEPRRGTVRVFTLAVHRIDPMRAEASLWSVERTEHDFHLLRSKLLEFHGDALLQHLPLPSRRDNSPLETIRYKYEDFLQRLLQMSLLHTSELLRIFLTEEGSFSTAVQAASLIANNTDLTNIYHSVTHRLRKEKGQHLEGFMSVLLISSDKDRWDQARRERDVELSEEVDEDFEGQQSTKRKRQRNVRDIHYTVFENNFNTEPAVHLERDRKHQEVVVGFSQCLVYLLIKVVRARGVLVNIIGNVLSMIGEVVDTFVNKYLNRTLRDVLSQRRLAHLIRLGHGLWFTKKTSFVRTNPLEHRERARRQLLNYVPSSFKILAGGNLQNAIHTAFDIIQIPELNKQLVYNLLDLCLVELFPELVAIETNEEPKS